MRMRWFFCFFLIGVFSPILMSADPEKNAGSSGNQYLKMPADYAAAKNDSEKLAILKKLIEANTANAHAIFYKILRTSDESDLSIFRSAIKSNGTTELLINLGPYMKRIQDFFRAEVKKKPDISPAELAELQKKIDDIIQPLQKKINELHPEFASIARKNTKALVAVIEKVFTDPDGEMVNLSGALFGLFSMKEEGAITLLKSLDSEGEAKGALSITAEMFGPYIVLPALKQYENPASTEKERKTAGLVIMMFADIEPVYDKIIEAYKHGRYFELKEGKKNKDGKIVITVKEALSAALSWWGNDLKYKYRDNEKFIQYVAKKYLPDSNGQEQVIEFLANTNFGASAPYFMELDFVKLSEKSLDALLQAVHISPIATQLPLTLSGRKKEYTAEKFVLYSKMFGKIDRKTGKSKKMLYTLSGFPAEYKEVFVESNINVFTEEEKKTIVFMCGSTYGKMPKDVQKRILNILRKNASPDLQRTIEYMEDKK